MAEQRKISVRKIIQVSLTAVVATCCVIAMVSASRIEGAMPLKSLPVVHIKNDRKYQFIEQTKIMDLAIYNRNIDIRNTPVSRIDVHGIERAIKADPWVADAQVFIDIERVMHIYVTQRVPVARIFGEDGDSYYMDSTLHTMPLSDNYTYYTMVVTNAPEMKNDSAGAGMKKQIARLVKVIGTDSFWSAQVSHIVVDSVGHFELIPVIGNQRILLGDTSNIKGKLGNLFVFYRNVLNRIGWDKYETLDVRFTNQVVASPSLPYKGPVDRAITKMNWITSIEVTEAQKMHEDSVREVNAQVARIEAQRNVVIARAKAKADAAAAELRAAQEAKAAALKSKTKTLQAAPKQAKLTPAAKENNKPVKATAKHAPAPKQAAGGDKHKNSKAKPNAKGVGDKQQQGKGVATKPSKKAEKPAAAPKTKAGKKEERKNKKQEKKAKKDKKKKEKENNKKPGSAKYTYPENKKK